MGGWLASVPPWRRPIRPAGRKGRLLPAPSVHPSQPEGEREICAVRADALGQLSERPVDMSVDFVGLGVDQTRRNAGDHMLERGTPLQCESALPKSQSEMHKKPEQQQ